MLDAMSEPEQNETQSPNITEANETPRSRALEFDPADLQYRRKKDLTAPLKPLSSESSARSPLLVVLAAVILLVVVAGGVFVLAADDGSIPQGSNIDKLTCNASPLQDANVRMGAGFDYSRAWILAAGESRLILEQVDDEWYRIENGWLHKDDVSFVSATACQTLPESESPPVFADDIPLPDVLVDEGWQELLGESFAVDVNGWLAASDPSAATIREGELILFSAESLSQLAPTQSSVPATLEDAYFAFRVEWVASDLEAEVLLFFRSGEKGAYQVAVRRDGTVSLRRENGEVLAQQINAAPLNELYWVGVWAMGESISIFINGNLILEIDDASLTEGAYYLGLQGRDSSIRISRFEIRVPPAND
jgi:hypothetical protein